MAHIVVILWNKCVTSEICSFSFKSCKLRKHIDLPEYFTPFLLFLLQRQKNNYAEYCSSNNYFEIFVNTQTCVLSFISNSEQPCPCCWMLKRGLINSELLPNCVQYRIVLYSYEPNQLCLLRSFNQQKAKTISDRC